MFPYNSDGSLMDISFIYTAEYWQSPRGIVLGIIIVILVAVIILIDHKWKLAETKREESK